MKNKRKMRLGSIFLLLMMLLSFSKAAVAEGVQGMKNFPYRGNVELDKRWTIRFTTDIDRGTINKENIKISLESNSAKTVDIAFVYSEGDNKTVVVKPTANYLPNTTYNLTVSNIKSAAGKALLPNAALQFTTKKVGSITGMAKVEQPIAMIPSLKKVTIQTTTLNNVAYFKAGNDGELQFIGGSSITFTEGSNPTIIVYFYDERANYIGQGTINVKEIGDTRVFTIDQGDVS